MKSTRMLVLSVLAFGLQGVAQAAPFPADAEASYDLPALETYAERHARMGDGPAAWGVSKREVQPQASTYPADAEASFDLPALETHVERQARAGDGSAAWGVSKRESYDPFPVGVGFIADD